MPPSVRQQRACPFSPASCAWVVERRFDLPPWMPQRRGRRREAGGLGRKERDLSGTATLSRASASPPLQDRPPEASAPYAALASAFCPEACGLVLPLRDDRHKRAKNVAGG